MSALAVKHSLAARDVAIGSNGVACTPLEMESSGLKQLARASVSDLTAESEIGKLLDGIRSLTGQAWPKHRMKAVLREADSRCLPAENCQRVGKRHPHANPRRT